MPLINTVIKNTKSIIMKFCLKLIRVTFVGKGTTENSFNCTTGNAFNSTTENALN